MNGSSERSLVGTAAWNGALRVGPTASRWLVRKLLEMCGDPPIRVVLWNGESLASSAAPVATVTIRDRVTLARLLLRPELAFGEGYASGRLAVEGDLAALLEPFMGPEVGRRGWRRVLHRLAEPARGNGLAGSRENVRVHYDLGNDFYRLWLDERLVYTCAYYRSRADSLEEAQRAKLDHVCRKLDLKPGERVLEVGCGWGALALHMAERYGVSVRAYNVSREQIAHARAAARLRALEDRVTFVDGDYREAAGTYDAFVSIGMLEHVGLGRYGDLGTVIDRTLSSSGRGLLHFVGRPQPCPLNAWTERHIFPGAYIPSLREALSVLEPKRLSVVDVEDLRFHYARTLEQWLERFERASDEVERRFGGSFVRSWRLYLASSMAGFRAGSLQLFQVAFARPARMDRELTRSRLYEEDQGKDHERWNAAPS